MGTSKDDSEDDSEDDSGDNSEDSPPEKPDSDDSPNEYADIEQFLQGADVIITQQLRQPNPSPPVPDDDDLWDLTQVDDNHLPMISSPTLPPYPLGNRANGTSSESDDGSSSSGSSGHGTPSQGVRTTPTGPSAPEAPAAAAQDTPYSDPWPAPNSSSSSSDSASPGAPDPASARAYGHHRPPDLLSDYDLICELGDLTRVVVGDGQGPEIREEDLTYCTAQVKNMLEPYCGCGRSPARR